jgi:hypothetical protein
MTLNTLESAARKAAAIAQTLERKFKEFTQKAKEAKDASRKAKSNLKRAKKESKQAAQSARTASNAAKKAGRVSAKAATRATKAEKKVVKARKKMAARKDDAATARRASSPAAGRNKDGETASGARSKSAARRKTRRGGASETNVAKSLRVSPTRSRAARRTAAPIKSVAPAEPAPIDQPATDFETEWTAPDLSELDDQRGDSLGDRH